MAHTIFDHFITPFHSTLPVPKAFHMVHSPEIPVAQYSFTFLSGGIELVLMDELDLLTLVVQTHKSVFSGNFNNCVMWFLYDTWVLYSHSFSM